MTCGPIAYAAAESSVTVDTGIKGQAKCNKIGALLLADGLAIMSGNSIEVTGKGKGDKTPPHNQLNGIIYKTLPLSGGAVKAWVFFNGGAGLSLLSNAVCSEHVDLNDGSKVDGAISSVTASEVVISSQTIPISRVSQIHSGRSFQFTYKGSSSPLTFQPTCIKAVATSKGITGKQILIGLALALVIAAAISIPVAIASSHHGHFTPPPAQSNGQNVVPPLPSFVTIPRRFPHPPPRTTTGNNNFTVDTST